MLLIKNKQKIMNKITFKIKDLYFKAYFNKTKLAKLDFSFYIDELDNNKAHIFEHKHLINSLEKYLNGELVNFADINLDLANISKFKFDILNTLKNIKYSNTTSYKELASLAGYPKAYQAVGQVLKSNQIPIIIPCHRVIKSNGELGGYNGGINLKKYLLVLEKTL